MKTHKPAIILATGGFDPIHEGHIALFQEAAMLKMSEDDKLIIGVNSNEWLIRKKSYAALSEKTRLATVSNMKGVDDALIMKDSDDSAISTIRKLLDEYPDHIVIFVNGGDRSNSEIPEAKEEWHGRVLFMDGIGGTEKLNSSSKIIEKPRRNGKDVFDKYIDLMKNAEEIEKNHRTYWSNKKIVNNEWIVKEPYNTGKTNDKANKIDYNSGTAINVPVWNTTSGGS